ncbi:hypothetical protein, partial [Eubacterium callanderi]|uniref:hypothetical protein n=1 Tax=Eubacterium callanderi TaxID=53442 RepID=UPI003AB3BF87
SGSFDDFFEVFIALAFYPLLIFISWNFRFYGTILFSMTLTALRCNRCSFSQANFFIIPRRFHSVKHFLKFIF